MTDAATLAEVLVVAHELRREVHLLRGELAAVRAAVDGRATTAGERALLVRLLPAIAAALGERRPFVTADVAALARESTAPPGLDAAAGYSVRRLGRLFARCAGLSLGGSRLTRIGTDGRCGAIWQVEFVRDE